MPELHGSTPEKGGGGAKVYKGSKRDVSSKGCIDL